MNNENMMLSGGGTEKLEPCTIVFDNSKSYYLKVTTYTKEEYIGIYIFDKDYNIICSLHDVENYIFYKNNIYYLNAYMEGDLNLRPDAVTGGYFFNINSNNYTSRAGWYCDDSDCSQLSNYSNLSTINEDFNCDFSKCYIVGLLPTDDVCSVTYYRWDDR